MTEKTNCKSINHKTSLKKCVEEHTVLLYEKSEILNLMVVKKNVPMTSWDNDWDWGVCQEKRPHDNPWQKKWANSYGRKIVRIWLGWVSFWLLSDIFVDNFWMYWKYGVYSVFQNDVLC